MDYSKLYGENRTIPKDAKDDDLVPAPIKDNLKQTYEAMMPAATEALWQIINDKKAPHSARMTAIMEVANRHSGKQAASVDAGVDNKLEVTIIRQCPDCGKVDHGK